MAQSPREERNMRLQRVEGVPRLAGLGTHRGKHSLSTVLFRGIHGILKSLGSPLGLTSQLFHGNQQEVPREAHCQEQLKNSRMLDEKCGGVSH